MEPAGGVGEPEAALDDSARSNSPDDSGDVRCAVTAGPPYDSLDEGDVARVAAGARPRFGGPTASRPAR